MWGGGDGQCSTAAPGPTAVGGQARGTAGLQVPSGRPTGEIITLGYDLHLSKWVSHDSEYRLFFIFDLEFEPAIDSKVIVYVKKNRWVIIIFLHLSTGYDRQDPAGRSAFSLQGPAGCGWWCQSCCRCSTGSCSSWPCSSPTSTGVRND